MTVKEILLEQFNACYDENGWFVALKNAVRNLKAEEAVWKPDGADNSIRGILAHLNFYNERYLKRFKREEVGESTPDNSETFANSENASEDEWKQELEKLDRIMSEWRALLKETNETRLRERVFEDNDSSWADVIGYINTHNAHHGGQIVVLRKLQGSWDASKGVS